MGRPSKRSSRVFVMRRILHADMDGAFHSVELRGNPEVWGANNSDAVMEDSHEEKRARAEIIAPTRIDS